MSIKRMIKYALFGAILALLASIRGSRTIDLAEIITGALCALLGALLVEIVRDLFSQRRKGGR